MLLSHLALAGWVCPVAKGHVQHSAAFMKAKLEGWHGSGLAPLTGHLCPPSSVHSGLPVRGATPSRKPRCRGIR